MQSKLLTAVTLLAFLTGCGGNSSSTDNNLSSTDQSVTTTATPKAQLPMFNDISKTRQALSANGIGTLGEWESDQMGGFMSITPYFQFGGGNIKNNLAYYLESENENYIKTLKLTLNINNKNEKKQALTKFKNLITPTFNSLLLKVPKELIEAVEKENEFNKTEDIFSTSLKLDKSKIDKWTLKIETK